MTNFMAKFRKIIDIHFSLRRFLLILLSLVWLLPREQVAQVAQIQSTEIINWATNIAAELETVRTLMAEDDVRNIYQDTTKYQTQKLNDNQAQAELERIANEINGILSNKEKLVMNIRTKVEENYLNHTDVTYPLNECVNMSYYRAKALTTNPLTPADESKDRCSSQSKKQVSLSPDILMANVNTTRDYATIHVPTNVYDMSETISNNVNWTSSLDETFKDNVKEDQCVQWQYFGGSSGFFKIYPGIMWNVQVSEPTGPVDFFDCRSQQWYLQASAYPKDMVIIIDMSGSMKGRRTLIANHTVTEILNTLTENDFFNVITFNSLHEYVLPAFKEKLIQATYRNKDTVIRALAARLIPKEMAEYPKGLEVAFDLLAQSRNLTNITSQSGSNESYRSNCQQVIMVISDGAPTNCQETFDKFNIDKNIRVFTYIIGQSVTEIGPVKAMACENRGFSTQIATLADVKENVQAYLDVIARTNALKKHVLTVWTQVHAEQMKYRTTAQTPSIGESQITYTTTTTTTTTTQAYEKGGESPFTTVYTTGYPTTTFPMTSTTRVISNRTENSSSAATTFDIKNLIRPLKDKKMAMYVSVAQAAYDKKNATEQKHLGILLGVAGVDVLTETFSRLTPSWKMSVNGYGFMITNNGFVIYHPNFRPTYGEALKPYYQNVDIADVEIPIDFSIQQDAIPFPNYTLKLRLDMVNNISGNSLMNISYVTDAFMTYFPQNMKYFYKGLRDKPYSLAIAYPWETSQSESLPNVLIAGVDLTNVDLKSAFPDIVASANCSLILGNRSVHGYYLSPFSFCLYYASWTQDPLCLITEIYANQSLRTSRNCSDEYLKTLYVDAQNTKSLQSKWESIWKTNQNIINDVQAEQVFFFHHTGLIQTYNQSQPFNNFFIEDNIDGPQSALYKTTIMLGKKKNKILYFEPPALRVVNQLRSSGLDQTPRIPVTTSIDKFGVLGLQVNLSAIQRIFESYTSSKCNTTNVTCLLVSNAGVIMASYNKDDIGQMLKVKYCTLMSELVNMKVFTEQRLYDFQGICNTTLVSTRSSAMKLLQPLNILFKLVGAILWQSYTMLMDLTFISLWNTLGIGAEVNPEYDVSLTSGVPFNKCALNFNSWQLNNTFKSLSNAAINCTLCDLTTLSVEPIGNTNLLLIVVQHKDKKCWCPCNNIYSPKGTKLEYVPSVVNETAWVITEAPRKQPPWGCVGLASDENSSRCTNSAIQQPRLPWCIILLVTIASSIFMSY